MTQEDRDLSVLEEKIGVIFSDKDLLRQALTHRSYINENRGFSNGHNERLEFLGDAVLELAVTDYLFNKYPERPEGDLTSFRAALVNTSALSEVAIAIEVNDYILLSKGESKDTGRARSYILADVVEALIGAIYIDKGFEKSRGFINSFVLSRTEEIVEKNLWMDAKSRFQELAQAKEGQTPAYKVLEESGPDHAKKFISGVFLAEKLAGQGEGESKQDAEQNAATDALKKRDWK